MYYLKAYCCIEWKFKSHDAPTKCFLSLKVNLDYDYCPLKPDYNVLKLLANGHCRLQAATCIFQPAFPSCICTLAKKRENWMSTWFTASISLTVFTWEEMCAIWMIIRMTIFWTVCTQNYIVMCNLNCAIQMMVWTVIWIAHRDVILHTHGPKYRRFEWSFKLRNSNYASLRRHCPKYRHSNDHSNCEIQIQIQIEHSCSRVKTEWVIWKAEEVNENCTNTWIIGNLDMLCIHLFFFILPPLFRRSSVYKTLKKYICTQMMVKSEIYKKIIYSSSLKQVYLQVLKLHNVFMGNCYIKSTPYKLQRKIHKSAIIWFEKMEGCEY